MHLLRVNHLINCCQVDQVDGEAVELNGGGGASSSSCTASQLGSAIDELMSTLRVEAINSIIKMSNQLI